MNMRTDDNLERAKFVLGQAESELKSQRDTNNSRRQQAGALASVQAVLLVAVAFVSGVSRGPDKLLSPFAEFAPVFLVFGIIVSSLVMCADAFHAPGSRPSDLWAEGATNRPLTGTLRLESIKYGRRIEKNRKYLRAEKVYVCLSAVCLFAGLGCALASLAA